MTWYYVEHGERHGPVDDAAFRALALQGQITPGTYVWNPDLPDWRPYGELFPVQAGGVDAMAEGAGPTLICAESGQPFPANQMLHLGQLHVGAPYVPLLLQRIQQGMWTPQGVDYASFGGRFAAKMLDNMLIGLSASLLFVGGAALAIVGSAEPFGIIAVLQLILWLGWFGMSIAYNTIFITLFGATPGKMALGIRVVSADGKPLSVGRALGRSLMDIVSYFIMSIGYLLMLFDPERRALHDMVCQTYVVREQGPNS